MGVALPSLPEAADSPSCLYSIKEHGEDIMVTLADARRVIAAAEKKAIETG
jgi:hypothetical protein